MALRRRDGVRLSFRPRVADIPEQMRALRCEDQQIEEAVVVVVDELRGHRLGGVAALTLQAAPCLLSRSSSTIDAASARGTVRRLILGNAAGSGNASDNTFGAGRVDALATVAQTLPTRAGVAA